ncbi:hypothetical protein EHP00_1579 [Ecytonucleospora hepatopenaei]|uniref:Uncharacterized protein n=1 Tax=Ecytonucleospora hepatopenaei TaxID=646526 RepID=A0A1W0E8N9_9MICR|nr:hypothetical protein EHP00_1579 [Ecytonucleospora hepatopenaei]
MRNHFITTKNNNKQNFNVPFMSKHINDLTKGRLLALLDENLTYKDISKKVKIPLATVDRIIKNSMERRTTDRKCVLTSSKVSDFQKASIIKLFNY